MGIVIHADHPFKILWSCVCVGERDYKGFAAVRFYLDGQRMSSEVRVPGEEKEFDLVISRPDLAPADLAPKDIGLRPWKDGQPDPEGTVYWDPPRQIIIYSDSYEVETIEAEVVGCLGGTVVTFFVRGRGARVDVVIPYGEMATEFDLIMPMVCAPREQIGLRPWREGRSDRTAPFYPDP